jgi:predicted lipoprotein with Yx(FWY)xxD motif
MKRITLTVVALLAMVALVATAMASSSHTASATATVKLTKTKLGSILTTGSGFTIYEFSIDGRNRDKCAAMAGCETAWPLVTAKGRPTAGSGVNAKLLGTIKVGGVSQVTYAGHPLYRFIKDSKGTTDGVGVTAFGGVWNALTAAGKTAHAASSTGSAPSSAGSGSTTPPSTPAPTTSSTPTTPAAPAGW